MQETEVENGRAYMAAAVDDHDDDMKELEPSRVYHGREDIPAPPRQARGQVTRRERWVNLPKTPEYQDWQVYMWTNFPADYLNTMADVAPAERKERLNLIFRAHNGWLDESGNAYPQPGETVDDGTLDFWDAIPQEVANTLIALMNVEQRQMSFLVQERTGTSRRS